ncbi:hypothetical protein LWI28_028881 [Acer negundo]|uniref:Uncharacterized protein n=1 Tax=Acer negundo TaxID=4023 RepID=A0AAD5IPS8_ACENE|nr:hypothetical protein LWI28_028881 [Acer negundo]
MQELQTIKGLKAEVASLEVEEVATTTTTPSLLAKSVGNMTTLLLHATTGSIKTIWGNGFNKNRNGRFRKNFSNDNLNVRKTDSVDNRTGLGNPHRLESDTRSGSGKVEGLRKIAYWDKHSNRPSGSRFNILSDENDVIMAEGGVKVKQNSDMVKKNKENVVLMEVTNQKNIQRKKAFRNISQSLINVSKKGTKKLFPVIHVVTP